MGRDWRPRAAAASRARRHRRGAAASARGRAAARERESATATGRGSAGAGGAASGSGAAAGAGSGSTSASTSGSASASGSVDRFALVTRRGIRRAGSFRRGKGEWRSVVGVGETHGGRLEHGALDGSLRALDDGVVPREVRVSREERVGVGVGEDRAERLEARRRVGGESLDGLRERAGSRPRGGGHHARDAERLRTRGRERRDRGGGGGRGGGARRVRRRRRLLLLRRHVRPTTLASTLARRRDASARARYWRPFAGRVVEVDDVVCAFEPITMVNSARPRHCARHARGVSFSGAARGDGVVLPRARRRRLVRIRGRDARVLFPRGVLLVLFSGVRLGRLVLVVRGCGGGADTQVPPPGRLRPRAPLVRPRDVRVRGGGPRRARHQVRPRPRPRRGRRRDSPFRPARRPRQRRQPRRARRVRRQLRRGRHRRRPRPARRRAHPPRAPRPGPYRRPRPRLRGEARATIRARMRRRRARAQRANRRGTTRRSHPARG